MMETQLQFPDLETAFTVSRVEVVSNVDVATIKSALRWLFDELQKQQAAKQPSDTVAIQQQVQDALAAYKEQKTAIEALQNRQDQLAERADKAGQDLQALQHSTETPAGAQAAERGTAGGQDLTKLQQQVQGLADSQAALAKDIAALKQNTAAPNSSNNGLSPAANPSSSPDAADTQKEFSNQAADRATQDNASSPSDSSPASDTMSPTQEDGSMGTQLNNLTAEVASLRADVRALSNGAAITSAPAVIDSGTPSSQTSAQTPPVATVSDRLQEQTANKIAEVSAALSALQQQMQGQVATVGDLTNAGAEVKRLLADKASLAEVQAVLKAQAGPTTVPVTAGGKVDMADMAGAVNGLGSRLASLEALLAATQQRCADKADTAELDNLRSAINKLKAAVGDDAVPVAPVGTSTSSDAADVVPAESDSPASSRTTGLDGLSLGASSRRAPSGVTAGVTAPAGNAFSGNALPGSISARLAILEQKNPVAPRAMQASGLPGGVTLGSPASTNAAGGAPDSDLDKRVAALESGFSTLSRAQPSTGHDTMHEQAHAVQPMQPRLAGPAGSAGTAGTAGMPGSAGMTGTAGMPGSAGMTGTAGMTGVASTIGLAGTAGLAPAQHVQTDAAVLSNLQNQIEELRRGKADKAGLEALQLRAAAHSAGANLGDSGDLSGLLETVQKMIAGKADKEELQALRRLLGDKVNLADYQAAVNNLERSLASLLQQPSNARPTAGSIMSGTASAAGAPLRPAGGSRGSGAFIPVRPGRRTLQDENQVPLGELGNLREEFQQLKAAVEVLTNATHLMAIPSANRAPSPSVAAELSSASGTNDAAISAANPGMAPSTSASFDATAVGSRATAAAGVPEAAAGMPAAAAAAVTAAAAIAGLHETPSAETGAGQRGRHGGQSHLVTGLANQKQVAGRSSQYVSQSEPGAPAGSPRAGPNTPSALAPTIGAVATGPAGLQGAGGLNGSGPLQELVTHMEAGQLGHKMNDSDIYDQLAQRLAALERLVRKLTQQAGAGTAQPGHTSLGANKDRPDERLLRRLGSDLVLLKKRVDELAPPKDMGTLMMLRDGDHAMLAAKPLQGYRCMACDRPLAKLDPDMGGFIPAAPMTVSVAMDVSKNNGILVNKEAGSKSPGKKGGMNPQQSRTSIFPGPPHAGEDPVGPQNWFKEAHGQPAEGLAREDVGPQLPPGGWRAGAPQPSRGSPRTAQKTSGSVRIAEEEELAAWNSQATVPLPDINAKIRS